jgi:hypothetical protein
LVSDRQVSGGKPLAARVSGAVSDLRYKFYAELDFGTVGSFRTRPLSPYP